jgi:hypothetical protein
MYRWYHQSRKLWISLVDIVLEESASSIIWPEEEGTRFLAKLNINITFLNSTFT